jgi:ABC-2 type transport system ATP-binding protein
MEPVIKVQGLSKGFKALKAVDGVTFEVYPGEILCVLGPNGAGKSTTINLLTTAMRPDAGAICFKGAPLGRDTAAYRQALGIVPQDLALYEALSAERNIAFFASLYGLRGKELKAGVDWALEFAGLTDRRRDRVKAFSGGMKRRLNIACAIAHRPEVIVLDEPTVGIDPQSRSHILSSIRALADGGATILYTTHYMEEVEEISTRIIIMDHGKIIAEGTKESLKEKLADDRLYLIQVDGAEGANCDALYRVEGVREVVLSGNLLKVSIVKGIENLDRIIAQLVSRGVRIQNIASETASLEMVFLNLTGRTLRD